MPSVTGPVRAPNCPPAGRITATVSSIGALFDIGAQTATSQDVLRLEGLCRL